MNARFVFDDRLYQRGQRWQECLEEWKFQRPLFLEYVQRKPILERSIKFLNKLPPYRIAVIYSFYSLDSLVSMPSLGWTFQGAKSVTARYFCMDSFFPLFADTFGKKTPRVLILNYQGLGVDIWGPRPTELTASLNENRSTDARESDRSFMRLMERRYPKDLDASLLGKLRTEFCDTVPNP